jgi:hypothetical protein
MRPLLHQPCRDQPADLMDARAMTRTQVDLMLQRGEMADVDTGRLPRRQASALQIHRSQASARFGSQLRPA